MTREQCYGLSLSDVVSCRCFRRCCTRFAVVNKTKLLSAQELVRDNEPPDRNVKEESDGHSVSRATEWLPFSKKDHYASNREPLSFLLPFLFLPLFPPFIHFVRGKYSFLRLMRSFSSFCFRWTTHWGGTEVSNCLFRTHLSVIRFMPTAKVGPTWIGHVRRHGSSSAVVRCRNEMCFIWAVINLPYIFPSKQGRKSWI